jgi:hypothetical protein
VLGGVLGDVVLPLLPEPMPLLGVLGVLGDVVLPVAPPLAPDPEPKWASHSAREIWPSLFLSTAEKLGAGLLAPALPEALGALSPLAAPVDDEPELCATATLAKANSAAKVAVLMSFNIGHFLLRSGCKGLRRNCTQRSCPMPEFFPEFGTLFANLTGLKGRLRRRFRCRTVVRRSSRPLGHS